MARDAALLRLRRACVSRPRAVMAVTETGLEALPWTTGPRRDPADELVPVEDLYHEHEVNPALRELLRAILMAGSDPQAASVALAQLDGVRARTRGARSSSPP